MRNLISIVAALVGLASVVVGVFRIYEPGGWISLGLALIAVAYFGGDE